MYSHIIHLQNKILNFCAFSCGLLCVWAVSQIGRAASNQICAAAHVCLAGDFHHQPTFASIRNQTERIFKALALALQWWATWPRCSDNQENHISLFLHMCSCEQIPCQTSKDVLSEKGHIAKLLNKRNLVNLINFSENSESHCQPKPSSHSRTFLSIMSICNSRWCSNISTTPLKWKTKIVWLKIKIKWISALSI